MVDWTQFFNPASVAWGSWSPPDRGMITPQTSGSPWAPATSGTTGTVPAAPASGASAAPTSLPQSGGMPSWLPQIAPTALPASANGGYSAPTLGSQPQTGTMTGNNANNNGQGWGNMLQKAAMMFQPQKVDGPPLQMAHPAGPGAGINTGTVTGQPLAVPAGGGYGGSPFNFNMTGMGNPGPGMLSGMRGF